MLKMGLDEIGYYAHLGDQKCEQFHNRVGYLLSSIFGQAY